MSPITTEIFICFHNVFFTINFCSVLRWLCLDVFDGYILLEITRIKDERGHFLRTNSTLLTKQNKFETQMAKAICSLWFDSDHTRASSHALSCFVMQFLLCCHAVNAVTCLFLYRSETISVSAPQKDIDAKNSTKSFLTFYVDDLSKMKWTVKNVLVLTLSVSFAFSFQKYVMFSCCPWLLYSPDMLFLFLFCPEILRCSFYWS